MIVSGYLTKDGY